MKRHSPLLLILILILTGCAVIPGGEVIQIASTTCVHNQSYNDNCKPTSVSAYLFKPTEPSKRLVIISHGSQGLDARHTNYARALNARGISALVIDHWTARGISRAQLDYAGNARRGARSFNMALDSLRAIEQLSKEPFNFQQFGYLGESMGGNAAILTAHYPGGVHLIYRREFGIPPSFDVLVALYPGCFERTSSDKFREIPLAIITGTDDNSTPAHLCRRYSDWMNSHGGRALFIELPGETHDFDAPYFMLRAPSAQNPVRCVSFIDGSLGRRWEETGEYFPNTAEGYRDFERRCLAAGSSVTVTAGHSGTPYTGYSEWLAFFGQHLR